LPEARPRHIQARPLIDPRAGGNDRVKQARCEGKNRLDAIERAIRSAFEKGDAEDKAFRERVYRKAFAALERSLEANPSLTVEVAIRRRRALQSKITEIESEFIPAIAVATADPMAAAGASEPFVTAPEPPAAVTEPRVVTPEPQPFEEVAATGSVPMDPAPSIDDPRLAGDPVPWNEVAPAAAPVAEPAYREPVLDAPFDAGHPGSGGEDQDAGASLATAMRLEAIDERARAKRRPLAIFMVVAILVALVAMGVWWAAQTGLFKSASERDTSVPNPPQTLEGEDFIPENEDPPVLSSEADPERAWITVFTPEDAATVAAPSDTTAEVMQDESGSFLRIRSGTSGAAIVFDVGQGVLEQVAGRTATFDIVARAEEGKETQMAVDCNFGELGDCGRKRYAVGYARGDYLFEITFAATQPGAGGTIAINSDFANEGKAVDIYEIKVSVAP